MHPSVNMNICIYTAYIQSVYTNTQLYKLSNNRVDYAN